MKKDRVLRSAYIAILLIFALLFLSWTPEEDYPTGLDIAVQSYAKGLGYARQGRLKKAKEQFERASKWELKRLIHIVQETKGMGFFSF